MKIHRFLLLAVAASATTLSAQQPDAPSPPKPPTPPETRSSFREHRNESAPKEKAVAYMGVLTREVPVELRSQFGLTEGFGLMVDEVMPDSPAKNAGIKTHDILVKFSDQQLVNMEQLLALVRSKKKGDVVALTVISGGKETQVSVALAERMMPINEMRPPLRGLPGMPQGQLFFGIGGQDAREAMEQAKRQMEQVQRQMHELQERMEEWNRNGREGPMPQMHPPRMDGSNGSRRNGSAPRENEKRSDFRVESHASANIIRRDDSGEYQLKNEDGKRTFIARPKNGEEQNWPVNTEEECQAVPEKLREKLRMFDHVPEKINIERRERSLDSLRPAKEAVDKNLPPTPKDRESSV